MPNERPYLTELDRANMKPDVIPWDQRQAAADLLGLQALGNTLWHSEEGSGKKHDFSSLAIPLLITTMAVSGVGEVVSPRSVAQAAGPEQTVPVTLTETPFLEPTPTPQPETGVESGKTVTQTVPPKLSDPGAEEYWTDEKLQEEGLMPKPGEDPQIPVDQKAQDELKKQYPDMPEYLPDSGESKAPGKASPLIQEPDSTPATLPETGAVFTEHPVIDDQKVFEVVGPGDNLKLGPGVVLRDLTGAETDTKLNDNVAEVVIVEGEMVIIKDGQGNEYKVWAAGNSETTQLTPIERTSETETGDLEEKISQPQEVIEKQLLYINSDDYQPKFRFSTADGSRVLIHEAMEAVNFEGDLRIKVRVFKPDGSPYLLDGQPEIVWMPLSGIKNSDLASLNTDQLKTLGFDVQTAIRQEQAKSEIVIEGERVSVDKLYSPKIPDRNESEAKGWFRQDMRLPLLGNLYRATYKEEVRGEKAPWLTEKIQYDGYVNSVEAVLNDDRSVKGILVNTTNGFGSQVNYWIPSDKKIAVFRRTKGETLREHVWPPQTIGEMTNFSPADIKPDNYFRGLMSEEQMQILINEGNSGKTSTIEIDGIEIAG